MRYLLRVFVLCSEYCLIEDILLLDSDMNCLSISSNDFCCGCAGVEFALRGALVRSPEGALFRGEALLKLL